MPNLFMVDLLGTEISEEEVQILKHPNVGAILLFTRNFTSPEQLKKLVDQIHIIRPDIFVAVDHEGGIVQRFQRHGFRTLPTARLYGDVFDLNADAGIKLAQHYGELMAKDLLSFGIDLSLAPVLDIHGISNVIAKLDRAFHYDPEVVVALATAFIQGMNKVGMPSVAKHFPGHGSVSADSHVSMPVSHASLEELQIKDLKPFVALIDKNLLDGVMPAHVIYKAIDLNMPAGFSEICLQGLLRNTLNFNGLILSDCLGMGGADIGNMNTRATQALKAGCDMLIVCNQTRSLLSELLESVNFEQTTDSAHRIEVFKSKMLRFDSADKIDTIAPYLSFTMHASATTSLADLANASKSSGNDSLNNTSSV